MVVSVHIRGWAIILVDDQAGSVKLFPYIQRLTSNVILTRIYPPFGDIVWHGNGPEDKQITVAVEYKQFSELLDSIINGRFAGHQVGGLVEHYDRRYLLVEARNVSIDRETGNYTERRGDRWQNITIQGRVVTTRDMEHWQTTIEEMAQFRVVRTPGPMESARWVMDKYTWYTDKKWDDHAALKMFHVKPPPTATFVKPDLLRRVAKELVHIGWDKSIAVWQRFRSVRQMINANESEWQSIDGIGKTIAQRVVAEINAVRKEI